MATAESTTGCFTCKSETDRDEKCDETQARCLRCNCRKSGIDSPGYTDVQHPNVLNTELRTPPAPLTEVSPSRAIAHQGIPLADTGDLDYEQVISEFSCSIPGASGVVSETPSESMDILKRSHGSLLGTTNPAERISAPLDVGEATPMTSSPVCPLGALFSLGQLKDAVPPSQCVQATANPCVLLVESQLPPYIKSQDDVTTCEDGDPEGVVSVVRRQPVLDRTVESNALPFVLQGYARWISRLALDPLKLKTIAREFVYSQFEDGDRSRWIIALLANIGSRVGSAEFVEGKQTPMLSALQTVTRQRLKAVKSKPNPKRTELVKAFDSATEAMVVQFYASPISEAVTLRQEAASIFRQLCPEPLDTPISLPSLLQNPLDCLWRYAEIDIIFSVTADMPTLFRYDVGILGSQPFSPYRSVSTIQREGIVQWLRGIPNQLVLLFAHMKTMREDGLIPNRETIMSLERGIHELQPFHGSASERFIAIMRSVVQECWRQAAFIYLYMAVCGDSPDTPRVREAFKRYMRLLNTTEPGRLPDEFLIFSFVLMGPAAQRRRDREVIRQRALRLHTRDCTHIATSWIILVIDDIWARADAEQRLAMWSDVAVSRKQFLNV